MYRGTEINKHTVHTRHCPMIHISVIFKKKKKENPLVVQVYSC